MGALYMGHFHFWALRGTCTFCAKLDHKKQKYILDWYNGHLGLSELCHITQITCKGSHNRILARKSHMHVTRGNYRKLKNGLSFVTHVTFQTKMF